MPDCQSQSLPFFSYEKAGVAKNRVMTEAVTKTRRHEADILSEYDARSVNAMRFGSRQVTNDDAG